MESSPERRYTSRAFSWDVALISKYSTTSVGDVGGVLVTDPGFVRRNFGAESVMISDVVDVTDPTIDVYKTVRPFFHSVSTGFVSIILRSQAISHVVRELIIPVVLEENDSEFQ